MLSPAHSLKHTHTRGYANVSNALLMDAIIATSAIRGKSVSPRTPSAVKGKLFSLITQQIESIKATKGLNFTKTTAACPIQRQAE